MLLRFVIIWTKIDQVIRLKMTSIFLKQPVHLKGNQIFWNTQYTAKLDPYLFKFLHKYRAFFIKSWKFKSCKKDKVNFLFLYNQDLNFMLLWTPKILIILM